ncbi:MAG: PTS sugar transporter subunit IIA [Pseudomonadota bacterium]
MRLGINEIAKCLDLPASTVDRWIRQGHIPVRRSGDACVFEVQALARWAAAKQLSFHLPEKGTTRVAAEADEAPDSLTHTMDRGDVLHDVDGDDVSGVLESAVARIPGISDGERQPLLKALLEREALTSTGIGNGIAIPHPRAPLAGTSMKPQITTCFLSRPIDFHAVDDRPVFVLFILISDSVQTHLHLLSRLAYGLRDKAFLEVLRSRPAKAPLLEQITEIEHRLDHSAPF